MSGKPSLKICSTAVVVGDEDWKIVQNRSGSITPTTFTERDYVLGEENPFFIDVFTFPSGKTIRRFAINELELNKATDASPLPSTPASAETVKSSTTKGSKKSRSPTTIIDRDSEEATIFAQEISALKAAIDYLMGNDDTQARCVENAVVVDVVDIDSFKTTGRYECHSTVLFRNPLSEDGVCRIAVIDPSNSKFSAKLGSKKCNELLERADVEIVKIISTKKIYMTLNEIKPGLGPEESRCCIDI